MKKRKILFWAIAVVCAAVIAIVVICSLQHRYERQAEEEQEIAYQLPVILPMKGDLAYLGEQAEWTVLYAQKQINEAGGINGIPVRMVIYDSEFNENLVTNQVKRIVTEQRFFIGPIDSVETAAIADLVFESKTPNIASYSYESVRDQTAPYGISFMGDSTEGEETAIRNWKKLNPDIEKVAILITEADSSQLETADVLREYLPSLGMNVSDIISIKSSENNGLNAVAQALNAKVDGYIILARSEEYGKIVSELRKRGITEGRRFTASFASYETNMVREQRDALAETYIWNKFDIQYEGEEWQKLLAAYRKDHGGDAPDSSVVPDIYNAVYAWKNCIEELGLQPEAEDLGEEKQKIAQWLFNSSVQQGIQGEYQWINGKKMSSVYYFQFDGAGGQTAISNLE